MANDSAHITLASKRDSSAMKAIAVLTMAFLPGTFLAVRPPLRHLTRPAMDELTRSPTDVLCNANHGF